MPRLIDADALKNKRQLVEVRDGYWRTTVCVVLATDIDAAPTIAPAPQWISVTERLPKEDGDLYIVTAYNEEIWWNRVVVLCAEYYRGSWTWNENGREWDLTDSVTHWMPLPKAPEDGGAENGEV